MLRRRHHWFAVLALGCALLGGLGMLAPTWAAADDLAGQGSVSADSAGEPFEDATAGDADSADSGDIAPVPDPSGVDAVIVESPEVRLGEEQRIAVLMREGLAPLQDVSVTLAREADAASMTLSAATVVDEGALASLTYDDEGQSGTWAVAEVALAFEDGTHASFVPDDADGTASFALLSEGQQRTAEIQDELHGELSSDAAGADGGDVAFVTSDETGELVAADDLGEVLEESGQDLIAEEGADGALAVEDDAVSTPDGNQVAVAGSDAPLAVMAAGSVSTMATSGPIIGLDPGHGGADSGAIGVGGLREADANWSITQYCKAKLENTYHLRTVLSKDRNETVDGLDTRVNRCVAAGAVAVISFHNDWSSSPTVEGSMVIIPNSGGGIASAHTEGQQFANKVLSKLSRLGFRWRGTLERNYPGSNEDYYGICRYARRAGITGVIIEHALVSNGTDANRLRDQSILKQMGEADADAIYEQWKDAKSFIERLQAEPAGTMFRLYNPNSGEHFFTSSAVECNTVHAAGWNYEGTAWRQPTSKTGQNPVYRLYNANGGEHHYTLSAVERDNLKRHGWKDEGIGWYSDASKAVPVYRVYNPNAFANNHHFTTSVGERDRLVRLGWRDEGIGWYGTSASAAAASVASPAPTGDAVVAIGRQDTQGLVIAPPARVEAEGETTPATVAGYQPASTTSGDSSKAMYRLYNPNSGEHFFTSSVEERNRVRSAGWHYEGTAWYSPTKETSQTPVYRLYNANGGEHHYTTSAGERDKLKSLGWKDEGTGWYSGSNEGVPVYRLYNPNAFANNHHFTTSAAERDNLKRLGWRDEGTAWYGTGTPIMGSSLTTKERLQSYFSSMVKSYPSVYKDKGAADAKAFAGIAWDEAVAEGVRPEVLLAQVAHETGWLKFGGLVKADQCNFGGIGATDHDPKPATFKSVEEGLRAQVQHLKAYASTDHLRKECIDPRFGLVSRGCSPTVEGLGGRWASGSSYGLSLVALMNEMIGA